MSRPPGCAPPRPSTPVPARRSFPGCSRPGTIRVMPARSRRTTGTIWRRRRPRRAPGTAAQQAFINQVARGAMATQLKYGVPASVTIAQAIDESGWGQSVLASNDHNLFGIKGTGPGRQRRAADAGIHQRPAREHLRVVPHLSRRRAEHRRPRQAAGAQRRLRHRDGREAEPERVRSGTDRRVCHRPGVRREAHPADAALRPVPLRPGRHARQPDGTRHDRSRHDRIRHDRIRHAPHPARPLRHDRIRHDRHRSHGAQRPEPAAAPGAAAAARACRAPGAPCLPPSSPDPPAPARQPAASGPVAAAARPGPPPDLPGPRSAARRANPWSNGEPGTLTAARPGRRPGTCRTSRPGDPPAVHARPRPLGPARSPGPPGARLGMCHPLRTCQPTRGRPRQPAWPAGPPTRPSQACRPLPRTTPLHRAPPLGTPPPGRMRRRTPDASVPHAGTGPAASSRTASSAHAPCRTAASSHRRFAHRRLGARCLVSAASSGAASQRRFVGHRRAARGLGGAVPHADAPRTAVPHVAVRHGGQRQPRRSPRQPRGPVQRRPRYRRSDDSGSCGRGPGRSSPRCGHNGQRGDPGHPTPRSRRRPGPRAPRWARRHERRPCGDPVVRRKQHPGGAGRPCCWARHSFGRTGPPHLVSGHHGASIGGAHTGVRGAAASIGQHGATAIRPRAGIGQRDPVRRRPGRHRRRDPGSRPVGPARPHRQPTRHRGSGSATPPASPPGTAAGPSPHPIGQPTRARPAPAAANPPASNPAAGQRDPISRRPGASHRPPRPRRRPTRCPCRSARRQRRQMGQDPAAPPFPGWSTVPRRPRQRPRRPASDGTATVAPQAATRPRPSARRTLAAPHPRPARLSAVPR